MAPSVEILISGDEIACGRALLDSAEAAARSLGWRVAQTARFKGESDWLCIWGPGHIERNKARLKQIENGGHAACWDMGYIGAGKDSSSYFRVSVDHNHPWRLMERTPSVGTRIAVHNIKFRNDYRKEGPVIVIGMGPKSREHLGLTEWEHDKLVELKKRFPNNQILYRPKPMTKNGKTINRDKHIDWPLTGLGEIEETLVGASLVVCRHSNVAVDACIAGIPVECEDGAAYWLYADGPNPSEDARADFLRRLAWWQYRTDEMEEAWRFLLTVTG